MTNMTMRHYALRATPRLLKKLKIIQVAQAQGLEEPEVKTPFQARIRYFSIYFNA